MRSEQPQRIETIPLSIRHVAVILVSVVVVLFAVKVLLAPIDTHHHDHDHSRSRENRVRNICQGLIVYAARNNDYFPSKDQWESDLITAGYIEPPDTISMASDGVEESYFLVATYNDFSPTDILIYENPKHYEEGVLVGFVQGHVEMVDHEVFEQMLADQLAQDPQP